MLTKWCKPKGGLTEETQLIFLQTYPHENSNSVSTEARPPTFSLRLVGKTVPRHLPLLKLLTRASQKDTQESWDDSEVSSRIYRCQRSLPKLAFWTLQSASVIISATPLPWLSRKQQMSPGCTASNTEVTKKSSLEATEKLRERLSTDFGSGKWSGPNSLTERCPRGHFYSSSVSLTSCQRYSKLDPVGWLRCLVWNRAGCSAEVSPQVTACRNWSWCWSRDRSRGIQI